MPKSLTAVFEKNAGQRAYNAVRATEELEKLARSLKLTGDDIEAIMRRKQIRDLADVRSIIHLYNALCSPDEFTRELVDSRSA